MRRRADLLIPPEVDVFEAVRAASAGEQPLACVLCDESQFFTPAQAEQLFMVTVDLNIPVICYGLRSDFSLKGFWNFSHYDLSVPYPEVVVENVHLGDSLMSLGYRLRNQD